VALLRVVRSGRYSHLLRVTRTPGCFAFESFFPGKADRFDGRKWWISEIGAISDDGGTVLAEFCLAGKDGWADYSWQTWSMDPPRQISVGLMINQ
jgi:hypothetical protein